MSINPTAYPVLLAQSQLFKNMPHDALVELLQKSKVAQYDASAQVLVLGARVVGLHVVLEGSLQVIKNGSVVRQLGQGGFFGERAILGIGVGATALIEATTPCAIMIIERTSLDDWFKKYPGQDGIFYKRLAWELGQRIYAADMGQKT